MSQGNSFQSFAGIAEVGRTTLYDWLSRYEEFKTAKDIGKARSEAHWMNIGKDICLGNIKGSASAWIFMMKNLHGWKDRTDSNNEANHQPLKIEIVGV